MITVTLDSASWALIDALSDFEAPWRKHMHQELPKELATKAEEHFKPMLRVRPIGKNRLEESIRHDIQETGDGWQVDYYGLFYGIYIDIGNFPPGAVLDANYYGHQAFPVDARLGTPYFSQTIHGMGHRTPGVPTHYSQKTVEWLADGVALEVAYDHVMAFLSEVIR